ncbi:MAG: hypothetical protein E7666_05445 [Ruminococcaceae bacterium]|nr:hypothetical protein [Oscillospiraceae bacterium]
MKRILSLILVIAMLAAMITIPTVTVSAAVENKAWNNTSDLFDTDAPMLYATKVPTGTTIDITDGKIDNAWANAYTLRVDYSQNIIRPNDKWQRSVFIDLYMMWDTQYLYILEERQYDDLTYVQDALNHYSGTTASAYYLSIPATYTKDSTNNDGAVNMVGAIAPNTATAAVGTPIQGLGTQRIKYYTGNTNATTFGDSGWAKNNNIETYTTLTTTGFMMETKVPWTELDNYNPGFSATKDAVLGFSFQYNTKASGSQSNYNHKQIADTYGFQQLKLVEGTNPTNKPIIPDFSWWNTTDKTFDISSEAQLLALVEMSQRHGASPFATDLGITTKPNFKDYTFNLTEDLTFNEGTTFNADGTWSGKAPVNGWGVINDFYGTFNGNGHTISGLYLPDGLRLSEDIRYVGLFGRVCGLTKVYDLNLTNGFLSVDPDVPQRTSDGNPKTSTSENTQYHNGSTGKDAAGTIASNQSAGSIAAVLHTGAAGGTFTLHNVTSDLHIRGTEFAGGIIGSTYSTNAITLDLNNVIFAGTVAGVRVDGGSTPTGSYAGRDYWSTYVSGTITDFYGTEGYKVAGSHNAAVKYQYTSAPEIQQTPVENGLFTARIIYGVNSLEWKNVGFKVTASYAHKQDNVKNYTTETVYNSVKAGNDTYTAPYNGMNYLYGLIISNIPTNNIAKITVTPIRTCANGVTTVAAQSYERVYKEGVESDETQNWEIFAPEFTDGTQTGTTQAITSTSRMKIYSGVEKDEFTSYVAKLQRMGYAVVNYSMGNNSYALCSSYHSTTYVTHIAKDNTLRIYTDKTGTTKSPALSTQSTTTAFPNFWQLSVDNHGSSANGGMSYVFEVEDGKFVIIDGGYNTETEADNLYNHLVANTPAGKTPVIVGWYISHWHSDHYGAMLAFSKKYSNVVDVEAFYYQGALPSSSVKNSLQANLWSDAIQYNGLHSGMSFNVGGLLFEVLFTREDNYPIVYKNENNNSMVVRVTAKSGNTTKSFMVLGDILAWPSERIVYNFGDAAATVLKSDIVQVSHHGYEGATIELYNLIEAPMILWPMNVVGEQAGERDRNLNIFGSWVRKNTMYGDVDGNPDDGIAEYDPAKHKYANADLVNASYSKEIIIHEYKYNKDGETLTQVLSQQIQWDKTYTNNSIIIPDYYSIYTTNKPYFAN